MRRAPERLSTDYNKLRSIDLTTNQVLLGTVAYVRFDASPCLVGGSLNAAKRRSDHREETSFRARHIPRA